MGRRLIKKHCVICGATFAAPKFQGVTCSNACRQAKVLQTKIANGHFAPMFDKQCVVCGAAFITRNKSVVTCGRICRNTRASASIRAKSKYVGAPRDSRGRVLFRKHCVICGAAFTTPHKTVITCTTTCTVAKRKQTCIARYGKPKKPPTPETKVKLRLQRLGKKQTPEHKRNTGLAQAGRKRGPHNPETRRKISSTVLRRNAVIDAMIDRFGLEQTRETTSSQKQLHRTAIYELAKKHGFVEE